MRPSVRREAWTKRPIRTSLRVAASLARRRVPGLQSTVVPYDDGRSRIVADLTDPAGLALYRYGLHDPDVELVRRLLSPGDVFVDGGANIGLFTLVGAAAVGPQGKVVSFEPATFTRNQLVRNVNLNDFGWVEVRSEALSDQAGELELVVLEETTGLSSFAPRDVLGGSRERVPVGPLDGLLARPLRERLKLWKLDVEGAEYSALLGARGVLGDGRAHLLLELDEQHLKRQGASTREVHALLEELGYSRYSIEWGQGSDIVLSQFREGCPSSAHPNVLATRDVGSLRAMGIDCRRP